MPNVLFRYSTEGDEERAQEEAVGEYLALQGQLAERGASGFESANEQSAQRPWIGKCVKRAS